MKYAIYKNEIGLFAMEYADTKEDIKNHPYIKEEFLPITINNSGGYCSFSENNYGSKFIEIIEINDDSEPLTREQMYPKNSDSFEYGWIDLEGNTYNTGETGHYRSAIAICDELNYNSYRAELELENRGWIKITRNCANDEKIVFASNKLDYYITKKQADTLFDLNLWSNWRVEMYIKKSENKW